MAFNDVAVPTSQNFGDDLLPIRYLNDFLFCERRAALHLLERIWRDNQFTLEGSFAHRRVDIEANHKRGNKRNLTGLWVVSHRLGLIGRCDLVEFLPPPGELDPKVASAASSSASSPAAKPAVIPFPVDFKRGRKRRWDNDEVQLCAQALCLEEMLGVPVPEGAIFHVKSQRRQVVVFDADLRAITVETVDRLRQLFESRATPSAKFHRKCLGCSLNEWCLPKSQRPRATPLRYLENIIQDHLSETEDSES